MAGIGGMLTDRQAFDHGLAIRRRDRARAEGREVCINEGCYHPPGTHSVPAGGYVCTGCPCPRYRGGVPS